MTLPIHNLDDFRNGLRISAQTEPTDPQPIIDHLEQRRENLKFEASLVPLSELHGWHNDPQSGALSHESGQFFAINGVRTKAGTAREVAEWDQPIITQPDGGILALACGLRGDEIYFLLQAKPEPGNIGYLQLSPTIQATRSNLRQAHKGKLPPLGELLLDDGEVITLYTASHNEEGGRFWRKTNENRILLVPDIDALAQPYDGQFIAASLSQIKALCLCDNVLSPFVKTIIAPF
ncbi:MAG: hypothetical protein HN658_11160 [Rhodospirillales bacterium]|jgi:oxidase EvaA|nr:hypothetical protein [Rhodospirillales bacterium]MBT4005490.1 hypothetical protein [Rhodospirillales bacterium]MBT5076884.1 hypothetical protein [Rhodospirillales bacterium]MBT5112562.1 hypothetical protein [Rhodospirillales bacterium]MBT5672086.1 hypothetical protein [Rhodospirillales bacterium]